ncbi:pyridoxamine 5'-phosphate oxidase family protein [Nakamurella aerolata]|nr:pyridoxamine 5'-phosphate oxidase family protein [Nakamurella aerolata]
MTEMTTQPPTRDRPSMPAGYGLPEDTAGLLDWAQVRERLVASKSYWLATVRPDGRPHVVPRWGVWLDDRFYYDGSPATVHVRNLRSNPACHLNLEDGTEAVLIEGTSIATRADADGLGARLAAAFGKYHRDGYRPEPGAWAGTDGGGLRVFQPAGALAWFDFPKDATRFSFAGHRR